jgi:hypothetical protein
MFNGFEIKKKSSISLSEHILALHHHQKAQPEKIFETGKEILYKAWARSSIETRR